MSKLPKFEALVEIEVRAEDIDAVDDLIHATWEAGDPADETDATIWTKDVEPVAEPSPASAREARGSGSDPVGSSFRGG